MRHPLGRVPVLRTTRATCSSRRPSACTLADLHPQADCCPRRAHTSEHSPTSGRDSRPPSSSRRSLRRRSSAKAIPIAPRRRGGASSRPQAPWQTRSRTASTLTLPSRPSERSWLQEARHQRRHARLDHEREHERFVRRLLHKNSPAKTGATTRRCTSELPCAPTSLARPAGDQRITAFRAGGADRLAGRRGFVRQPPTKAGARGTAEASARGRLRLAKRAVCWRAATGAPRWDGETSRS